MEESTAREENRSESDYIECYDLFPVLRYLSPGSFGISRHDSAMRKRGNI